MRYYLIAGEASGDLHGSNLMRGLFAEDPDAQMRFWGGPLMDAVCREHRGKSGLVRDYKEGAVMGFVEVVFRARKLIRNVRSCEEDILGWKPDVVILIDYPGFNFKIAQWAHNRGIKVYYYIAPKVWASRERRVRKLKEYVDRLFIIFPFEKEYFTRKGIPFIYKGNPLIDAVDNAPIESRADAGLPEGPYIALLAGSRAGEVASMMKVLVAFADALRATAGYEAYHFVIAGAPSRQMADYQKFIGDRYYIRVVFGKTYTILRHAEMAVINSGTASLEAALLGTPQVVGYVTSEVSMYIARKIIHVPYISLGNLIAGREVFRELLQYYLTPESLVTEVRRILEDPASRAEMLKGYARIRELLGGRGASAAVARAMIGELRGISRTRDEIRSVLHDNILSYWLGLQDPRGGFYGEVDGEGRIDKDAPRGVILNARIIWAFSAAFRALQRPEYREAAAHAARWFLDSFVDPEYGGVFWSVDAAGAPLDTKKQLYSQGFAIYGLAEYASATGDKEALDAAVTLFHGVESRFKDSENGGYIEALGRDFSPLEDMSLSAHDINADKTMNSHLHLLEAYAALYRVWPDPALKQAVEDLLEIVCHRILGKDGHLQLYFDRAWNVLPGAVSYGHDIETSWLSLECARSLGDRAVEDRIMPFARRMGEAGNEGLLPDGSMRYELLPDGTRDDSRQWWVQAEAVVGNLWLWKYHNEGKALERALRTWDYIRDHLIDTTRGEWYWAVLPDGSPDLASPKAGFWKCPYHNTRMCLEALSILGTV